MDQILNDSQAVDETVHSAPEQEVLTESNVDSQITDSVTTESQVDPLSALITRRMGAFDVKISPADLKYLRNSLQSKIEWKGPNEAYLVIMAILTLNNALEGTSTAKADLNVPVTMSLPSSTIESVSFFLNRITGSGLDSAQRVFGLSMIFRQSIEAIRALDTEIEALQRELSGSTEAKN